VPADRNEIRDHLAAVIEAARELPRDDRTYLADTFLDDLESNYQLVPRSGKGAPRPAFSRPSWPASFSAGWSPLRVGVMIVLAMLLLPFAMFVLSGLMHPPVLVLAVVLLFVVRSGRHRGPRRRGPTGRMFV
jgi:hypothetical protein